MGKISTFLKSEYGKKVVSILLGLGVAGLFKMSCDNRSCIVYKGPQFNEKNKTVKYMDKCFGLNEHMLKCDEQDNREKVFL